MDPLSQLLSTLNVEAKIFHNGQYCENWAVDTSGKNHISFHIVNHGQCYLHMDGAEALVLNTGDMVIFPHDSRHQISNSRCSDVAVNQQQSKDFQALVDNGTGLICGYFEHQNPLIKNITRSLPEVIVSPYRPEKTSITSNVRSLLIQESINCGQKEYEDDRQGLVLNKLAQCLLILLFRDELPVKTGVLAAMAHPKLSAVIQAMHAKPDHKWTLLELCTLSNMSRPSFSKLFKDVVGQTPMEYLLVWRMTMAYRLLADEKVTTLQAALSCGYENESSFSKVFKRVVGVGPGAVRQ